MHKIRNIIVATDFSTTARNAFQYAKHLAEALDAHITVVHVNEYFMPGDEVVVTPIADMEITRQTNEAMALFVAEEEDESGQGTVMVRNRVKTRILKGDLLENLVNLSKYDDTDLIVIGMTGSDDFLSKIIGATSMETANKAHCPVILVPRAAQWRGLSTIMYASNYDATTPKMIEEVTTFARTVHASIHFVHIADFNEAAGREDAEISWDELFPAADPGMAFEVHAIYGQDKIKELKKYASSHDIDLMAFVSKQRNFWEKLIHKSVTENVALSTDIPMMVVHLHDKV